MFKSESQTKSLDDRHARTQNNKGEYYDTVHTGVLSDPKNLHNCSDKYLI